MTNIKTGDRVIHQLKSKDVYGVVQEVKPERWEFPDGACATFTNPDTGCIVDTKFYAKDDSSILPDYLVWCSLHLLRKDV